MMYMMYILALLLNIAAVISIVVVKVAISKSQVECRSTSTRSSSSKAAMCNDGEQGSTL
jgi:uncharacterized membrane protein